MTTIPLTAPFSAFGTLSLLPVRDSGPMADWAPQPVLVSRHIPGAKTSIRQNLGAGPLTVNWLVLLASDADFQAFVGLQGTSATLRVLAGATSWPGDRAVLLAGEAYKEFDTVWLTTIANVTRRISGQVVCTATFERGQP